MVGAANSGFSKVQRVGALLFMVATTGTSDCHWLRTSLSNCLQNSQFSDSNTTSCRTGFKSLPFKGGGDTPASDEAAGGWATFCGAVGYFTPVPPRPQYPSGFFFR